MDKLVVEAMKLIKSRGDKGIVQSDLWKKLKIDSKRGSRLVQRLILEGRITRRSVVFKGRRTFLILPIVREVPIVPFNTLAEVPCFKCPELGRCTLGYMTSPYDCLILGGWLEEAAREWNEKGLKKYGEGKERSLLLEG